MEYHFCEVVFNRPLNQSFIYRIPPGLKNSIKIGIRVKVSFGKSDTLGYVVGFLDKTDLEDIKDVKDIVDEVPVLDSTMFRLAKWISEYYFCSLGEAMSLFFPGGWRKIEKTRPRHIEDTSETHTEREFYHPFLPTSDQSRSIERINQALENQECKVFLLHGVTASGKTEVYLQVAAKARTMGGGVIVLVPEIVLTHEIVRAFQSRFGTDVAIWHSRLRNRTRYKEWVRIRNGEANIVIGPRSAIFSPVRNIKLIIVDEEHENSYKQSEKSPRYHGRDTAIMRGNLSCAVTILGSATPSLESYYHAVKKKYELIELPRRVDLSSLPEVKIVDLRAGTGEGFLSEDLKDAIRDRLLRGEQTILFINRRGFSYFILCQACGHVLRCRNCAVSLTYHRARNAGLCHYCGYREKIGLRCPICNNEAFRFMGLGTEKIEEEVKDFFPEARVRRLDSDVTAKKNTIPKVLEDLRRRRIDILVGTQMTAKGLDFPHVTLIGVVLADGGLNIPDFRAGERTFQLLTQVAGRSGRGARPGLCIIQTYNPAHYSIASSARQDYLDFFRQEIRFRKELYYPPLCRFIRITIRGKAQEKVKWGIERFVKRVEQMLSYREMKNIFLVGPSPAPISRIRGKYRWQFCLKTKDITHIRKIIRDVMEKENASLKGLDVIVDADPVDMF